MTERHLYTLRWTQPYATDQMRPYLRTLREALDRSIEDKLNRNEFGQAKEVLTRIMKL
jgi:hypothetical protein